MNLDGSKQNNSETFSNKAEELARIVPYNIQAEQALLGAIIVNNESIYKINDFLLSEHFFEPIHQRIFDTILKLLERGIVATPVTLKNHFEKDEALKDLGGSEYIFKLSTISVAIINLQSYAKVIYDMAVKRNLIAIGEDIVNDSYDNKVDITARHLIERTEQKLFNLAVEGSGETGFKPLKDSLIEALDRANEAYKRTEKITGLSSGFQDVDNLLGGLQNSDLLILAGRPSMGKTAFAINMAVNSAKYILENEIHDDNDKPFSVGFFSLEMSSEQLAARMIAMESGVNSSKMRTGNLNDDEFAKLVRGNKELYKLPFYMDDTPALSISALRTRARRLKRKSNLGLIVVDYLQLMKGSSKQEANRVQEVSEVTQGLKAVAKELNVPVIALSQLSRAVEQREDKRPQLSDLRESGSIEQDADIVMFIYREEYYEERKKPSEAETEKFARWQEKMDQCHNLTEIIVAKQRHGPIGTAKLFFNSNTTKFENYAENY